MGRRREPRLAKTLPVRVWGLDRDGNRFMVDAHTIDISGTGARLDGVWAVKGPGDTIEVRHRNEKTRFRVVWVGQAGTPQAGQIGVRSSEPGKSIWGVELPAGVPDDYQPAQPKELWKETGAAPMVGTQSWTGPDRRAHPRYTCRGQVKMLPEGSNVWLTGGLSEIGLGGCYVETMSPLPCDSQIQLELTVGELVVRTKGQVKLSSQGMGMGIAFAGITADSQQILQQLVARAAGAQEAGQGSARPQPIETHKEDRFVVTPSATTTDTVPTSSDVEVAVESLFKLLERKAVLTRQEYVELMRILKSLSR
jgi:hypothetical protein